MKRVNLLFIAVLAIAFSLSTNSFAQEKPEGHLYTVTTWKIAIPEDGSRAELDSLMTVYHNKVVAKNDKIVSTKVLHHYWGSDNRDVVFINEYASWGDIEAAGDVQEKLTKEAWPDKAEAQKFFKAMGKYMIKHSDEIYMGMPDMAK